MRSYYFKTVKSSEAVSDSYISVNNFGYYEDVSQTHIRRERGRADYQLIYVKSGKIIVHEPSGDHILEGGSVCLFRPGESQIYSTGDESTTFFWIHFSGSEVEGMLSFFSERAYYVGAFPEFEGYCHGPACEFEQGNEYAELFCRGELIALIARIAERTVFDGKKRSDRAKIRPALNAIHENFQSPVSNEELARICGMSKCYFVKIFKKAMGVTPQQYYAALVVDKARYLLTATSYNVSEISLMCGIEDNLYFSRFFKKHTGLSPMAYRKNV